MVRDAGRKDYCCICDKPLLIHVLDLPIYIEQRVCEQRPTGAHFSPQLWNYCVPCWNRHVEICGQPIDIKRIRQAFKQVA